MRRYICIRVCLHILFYRALLQKRPIKETYVCLHIPQHMHKHAHMQHIYVSSMLPDGQVLVRVEHVYVYIYIHKYMYIHMYIYAYISRTCMFHRCFETGKDWCVWNTYIFIHTYIYICTYIYISIRIRLRHIYVS